MTVLPTILNRQIRPKRSNSIAMDQFCYLDRRGEAVGRDWHGGWLPGTANIQRCHTCRRMSVIGGAGKHLLGASISQFDPRRKSTCTFCHRAAALIWRPIDPGQHEYRREPANDGDWDLAACGRTLSLRQVMPGVRATARCSPQSTTKHRG